jgi:anaerobic ribonucleoside-triphosphate reductase activating protein
MNYSDIKYTDMVNGKGIRVSLFVSGCNHKCKECFNRVTWNPDYGKPFTNTEKEQIFSYFEKYRKSLTGLSLLGGDPTFHSNIKPLTEFVKEFKSRFPEKDVWIWSGFTFEQILADPKKLELVRQCDILVDGKFMIEQKTLGLKYRGSANQRVINVQASLANNKVVEA